MNKEINESQSVFTNVFMRSIADKGSFYPISSAFPWYEFSITAVITQGYYDGSLNALCLPDGASERSPAAELSSEGNFAINQDGIVSCR